MKARDCSLGGGTTALEWTTKVNMSCYVIKLFVGNRTPMVKWLSCLPSKQAARVRFPFGV